MELTKGMVKLAHYYIELASMSIGYISDDTLVRLGLMQDGVVDYLAEKGVLVDCGNGEYDIINNDFLYEAALKMIIPNWLSDDDEYRRESAVNCLRFIINRDSSYIKKLDILLNQEILNGYYGRFTVLYDVLREYNPTKLDYYLLLVTKVLGLPQGYLEKAKAIRYQSILVKEGTALDDRLNDSRKAAYYDKYPLALRTIKNCLSNRDYVDDRVEEKLLLSAYSAEKQVRGTVYSLACQEKYEELVSYIEGVKAKTRISVIVRSIKKVAKSIIDMQNGVVLEVQDNPVRTVFNAIYNNNFSLAYQMCNKDDNSYMAICLRNLLCKASILALKNGIDEKTTAYVKEMHEELLKKKTLVISRPMNDDEISAALSFASEYPDMILRMIKDYGDRKRIVFKYYQIDENYSSNELYNIAEDFQRSGMTTSACDYYKKAFVSENFFAPGVCVKIAICLMLSKRHEEALDYYILINALNREKGLTFNFYDRILEIQSIIESVDLEEVKPQVSMNASDWSIAGLQDDYGIKDFETVSTYIELSGLPFDVACRELLNYSDEQIDLIKLRYAREFYRQGFFDRGDRYVREVEHSPNKTQRVKEILNIVRTNKRFYQYKK